MTTSALAAVRYRVAAFTVALAFVTYLDRVCISKLAGVISTDLGLTMQQMGFVFTSFSVAYALFEVPTARWADKLGSRVVLSRIVIWWSVFTIITAAAFSFWSLIVIRFLFGIGEAGAWPVAARALSRWIPQQERGRVQGIFFAGAHLAGGITPYLAFVLEPYVGWRMVFVLFGCVGFAWAAGWYFWFRDEPREHASVTVAERDYIEANRSAESPHGTTDIWRRIAKHPSMLPLCMMYIANTYGFFFTITWLPKYLEMERGFSGATLAALAGLPLILSIAGDFGGGWTTDWAARRFGLRLGRAVVAGVSYLIAGLAMAGAAIVADPMTAAVLIAVSIATSMFTLAASWATCVDIGGTNAGVVSAFMNTSGQIGGIVGPALVPWLVDGHGGWPVSIAIMSALYLIAAVCWLFIDARPEDLMFRLTIITDPDEEDNVLTVLHDTPLTGVGQTNRDDGLVDIEAWYVHEADADDAAKLFPKATVEPVANENWNAAWQAIWEPLEVGERWYLVPPGDSSATPAGRLRLEMQAGLAFGNGDHPTTHLCLRAMERGLRPGDTFLDVGCGSGLLGEAASLLGARAFGCDLNPTDLPSNAYLGSIDALQGQCTDVAVMNIQAGTLIELWPELTRIVRREAILSGYLPEQAAAIEAMIQAPWRILHREEQGGWCALIATTR